MVEKRTKQQQQEEVKPLVGNGNHAAPAPTTNNYFRRFGIPLLVMITLTLLWIHFMKEEESNVEVTFGSVSVKNGTVMINQPSPPQVVMPQDQSAAGASEAPQQGGGAASEPPPKEDDEGEAATATTTPDETATTPDDNAVVETSAATTEAATSESSEKAAPAAEETANEGDAAPEQQLPQVVEERVQAPPATAAGGFASLLQTKSQQFATSKQALKDQLLIDYGEESYTKLFETNLQGESEPVGRSALLSLDSATKGGWNRMKRKLKLKVLKSLLQQSTDAAKRRRLQDQLIPFVWATGGHSASAGHGNLYNESYTAVLERQLQPVFAAVGLHVTGRNYAMGGTSSAPECALCVDAIYGTDIDVLSWDFGMTDGRDITKMLLYFYHAGLNPGRPVGIPLIIGSRSMKGTLDVLSHLESIGLPVMYLDQTLRDTWLNERVPNSFGKTLDELRAMPKFVQTFRCNKGIETGEPNCGTSKFSMNICPQRKYKTSWHPGWKWHALIGNLVSLSMIEMLNDALVELLQAIGAEATVDTVTGLLNELQASEDAEYQQFQQSPVSELAPAFAGAAGGLNLTMFFKRRAYCRTGRTPAHSRIHGYMFDQPREVAPPNAVLGDFQQGTPKNFAQKNPNAGDFAQMRLVFDENERQTCPVPVNVDFKDYWLIQDPDGWQSMTIPNDAEDKAYNDDNRGLLGYVMICLGGCNWGKCKPEDLRETLQPSMVESGKLSMVINQIPVKRTAVSGQCVVPTRVDDATGQETLQFPLNDKGKLQIDIRVLDAGSYLRISSVVVW